MQVKKAFHAIAISVCPILIANAHAADWMQFGYDAAHSGNNTAETVLTRDNVVHLQRRYQASLPANVDSAPVYLSAVETSEGTKDLLFMLAENGTLMAIDAADGSEVWSHRVTGEQPTTASPAIDPGREYVYSYGLDGNVHKYHVGNGNEVTSGGWPELVTTKTGVEKMASGLTIAASGGHTYLYAVTDGYIGDGGDYQGHLTTIDLANGQQTVFNTLCSDVPVHFILNGESGVSDCDEAQSGIWGRGGATFDTGTNQVYISTGNGLFDANTGGYNWGDSVLGLGPNGTGSGALPLDSYTPTNYQQLDSSDIDLGSVSLAILPVSGSQAIPHLGAQLGKDHQIRLINLDNMSGANIAGAVGGEELLMPIPQGGSGTKEQPAVWVDGNATTWLLIANNSGVSGLKLGFSGLGHPTLTTEWQHGGTAKSAIVANGILYYAASCSGGNCLFATDPTTGDILWTSAEHIGSLHWQSPILVNGAIYMTDDSSKLHRFDVGNVATTHIVTPSAGSGGSIAPDSPQTVDDGETTQFTVTPAAGHRIASVTGCGGELVGSTYTTGAITADCAVSAVFEAVTHVVTPDAGAGGTITPNTPQTVDDGTTTAFTIAPDATHAIDSVTGCNGALSGTTYTTGAITADCTVTATFRVSDADIVYRNGFDPVTP